MKSFIKFFSLLLIFCIYFSGIIDFFVGDQYTQYFDEAFIAIFILILFYNFLYKKNVPNFQLTIGFFILLLILLSYISIYHNDFIITLAGSVIHLKLFIMFFVFFTLFYNSESNLKKVLKLITFISITGIIINLILGSSFNSFFNQNSSFRGFFLRISGFELHFNKIALLFTLLYIYYNFHSGLPSYKKLFISSTLFFLFCSLIIVSRTPIIIIIFSIFYVLIMEKNKIIVFGSLSITMILLFIILSMNKTLIKLTLYNIAKIEDKSEYERGLIVYLGFYLFTKHFPFGTGASTFGTSLSANNAVYDVLGISNREFILKMSGVFDSNIASIAGEFGFVGFILFSFLSYYLFRFIRNKIDSTRVHYFRVIFLSLIVNAFISTVFMGGFTSLLYAIFLNINIIKEKNNNLLLT